MFIGCISRPYYIVYLLWNLYELLTSSSQGMMQGSWYTCSQTSLRTGSLTLKSSQHTLHWRLESAIITKNDIKISVLMIIMNVYQQFSFKSCYFVNLHNAKRLVGIHQLAGWVGLYLYPTRPLTNNLLYQSNLVNTVI